MVPELVEVLAAAVRPATYQPKPWPCIDEAPWSRRISSARPDGDRGLTPNSVDRIGLARAAPRLPADGGSDASGSSSAICW
jgi:hypothetical protein